MQALFGGGAAAGAPGPEAMAGASGAEADELPPAVLRALSDKLYERRKVAALEVERAVKNLNSKGDHKGAMALVESLARDFARSPNANHRKGGLIGLAAATVGLIGGGAAGAAESKAVQVQSSAAASAPQTVVQAHLAVCVPPVLDAFGDADGRVRYYACEALYNIAKVAREAFVPYFPSVFDALCRLSADNDSNVQNAAHLLDRLVKDIVTESPTFDVVAFIPLLRERMGALNPYVRQFLVGWITLLDSVPDIDMVEFLPDLLDGLFGMLGDAAREIRLQADTALEEFLRELRRRARENSPQVGSTSLSPVSASVSVAGEQGPGTRTQLRRHGAQPPASFGVHGERFHAIDSHQLAARLCGPRRVKLAQTLPADT